MGSSPTPDQTGSSELTSPAQIQTLLADLDPDQRAAVTADHTMVAVIAGAGSGKTRVLTRRIAYRIARGDASANRTLALTFTREAAGELRRRLRFVGVNEHIEAGTFHSVMLGVLKQRWADTGTVPRTVLSDRRRYLMELVGDEGRGVVQTLSDEVDWATARGVDAHSYTERAREAGRRPSLGLDRVAQLLGDYDQLKRRRGVIDFDDVLANSVRDMVRDPQFAAAVRWRYRHLYVDEAQDLNPVQHRLLEVLRGGRSDLFLVGDPAQAIYGFNGADPSLLVDVERRFPGIEVIRLPVNHRCTPQVVGAGNHVLRASGMAADAVARRPDGPNVEIVVAPDGDAEAESVARLVAAADPGLTRAGNVAVLARTNAQLRPIHAALTAARVPVRKVGAGASPRERIVREACALPSAAQLRAWAHDTQDALGEHPSDDDTLRAEVADAVLRFLRDQPIGSGADLRTWVLSNDPFGTAMSGGVDLLSFHAAKGREWHTVVLAGVETSLVPHKSATTNEARAEEARLLYVACTRATDRLLITHATRRGGYARKRSPLLADIDLEPAPLIPPPLREAIPADPLVEALTQWRASRARRSSIDPDALMSEYDLGQIAARRPRTVDELVAATSLGPLTAKRLAVELLPLVAQENDTITGA